MSNFTKPSVLIFIRSDWQASSFAIFARFMTSKILSGFSRSALRIFSRSFNITGTPVSIDGMAVRATICKLVECDLAHTSPQLAAFSFCERLPFRNGRLAICSRSMRRAIRGNILTNHVEKGDQSCHVEPLFRLLHPLSLASGALRPFQLTPSHIVVAPVAPALLALASIMVVSTMVRVRRGVAAVRRGVAVGVGAAAVGAGSVRSVRSLSLRILSVSGLLLEPAPARRVDPRPGRTSYSGDDEARRWPRSHTPKAITTAPARANQVMAYCRWSSLRWTSSAPGFGMPLAGTGCSRST